MPSKPSRPCNKPGCKELSESGKNYCKNHKAAKWQGYDSERGSSTQRGYNYSWRKIRLMVLREEPLCRACKEINKITAANEVDHIDNNSRNNLRANLQPLCKSCHSRKTVKGINGVGGLNC